MQEADKILLAGNQAVAYAAMDVGVAFFSHYPGSPVTTVESSFKHLKEKYELEVIFNNAHNEHVAALSAMGASFAEAKSMLVMKHVGLNIAADPLVYSGYSGVKGGMVVVVGTDPGANSSTGEQDVHWYAKVFNFPLFEPTNVQEIYQQIFAAYALSEAYEIPVFVFIPVELTHTVASIQREQKSYVAKKYRFEKNRKRYINVGQRAVDNHQILVDKIKNISKIKVGQTYFDASAKFGIITRGLAYGYTLEAILKLGLQEKVHLLQIDRVFPVSPDSIVAFAKNKTEIVFIEDQDGFLETMVKQLCFNELLCKIYGKDIFPSYGALKSGMVLDYLSEKFSVVKPAIKTWSFEVEERLGVFCEGCPHTASYYSIFDALEGIDFVLGGDIGCSSLPPFKADWLLCMNAGIGVSQGIAMVSPNQLVISTGGDGSFFHGGMISLQSAVENKVNLIHIVFDNQYVAMTGHQYSPSQGSRFKVKQFLEAIGVERFHVVDVFEKDALQNVLKQSVSQKGVRVIWARGACALVSVSERGNVPYEYKVFIDAEKCEDCNLCYEKLACPAIQKDENKLLFSDEHLCVRCGVCQNICPKEAITNIGL